MWNARLQRLRANASSRPELTGPGIVIQARKDTTMSITVQTPQKHSPATGVVVPAFNGEAEKFVLRAFRLFRRTLVQVNGDAGKVLTKHLRTRLSPDSVNGVLGDLA